VASRQGDGKRNCGVDMDHNPIRQIALIGFGEVGGIFGSEFAAAGLRIYIFDILLNG
jgi:hypothetical protein